MSDESETQPSAVQEVLVADAIDWFLQSTIQTVINHGVEMGVILTVGGSTISGLLISGRKYFEELADTVGAGSRQAGDIHNVLGDAWREYRAIYE